MLTKLYEKHLWEVRHTPPRGKNLLDFGGSADEYRWLDPNFYNQKYAAIPSSYGSYYNNSFHDVTTITRQPHGDFRSSYAYFRQWKLDVGGAGVGIDYSRPPSSPSKKSIYRCQAPVASWVGGHSSSSPVLEKVMNDAQYALIDKLRRDLPEWDILTDFVELGETLGFTKETAKRLTDIVAGCLLRQPRRVLRGFLVPPTKKRIGHVKSVIDHSFRSNSDASVASLKAAGSLWLSYRYGLMPLLYSTQDAIAALSYSGENREFMTEAQVTFYQKYNISDLTTDTWDTSNLFKVKVRQYHVGEFSYRLKARMSWADSFADRLRLNPVQLPTVLYENIPFSFVLDWFFDVNSWLIALQVEKLATKMKIDGTLKDQCVNGESVVGVSPVYNDGLTAFTWSLLGKSPVSTTRSFRRYPNISLSVSAPSISNGLNNFKRQMDALALSTNFLKHPSMRKIPS